MKKNKIKKILLISFIIIMLLLTYPSYLTIKLTSNGYDLKSSYKIITSKNSKFAINNKYSKTFDVAINSDDFINSNKNHYIKINYHDNKGFIKTINTLIKKGYTEDQINIINKKIKYENVLELSKKYKIDDIEKYLEINHFAFKNIDRYINYNSKVNDYNKTITYVNIGLDQEPYTNAEIINEFNVLMIANKYNKLDESFEPPNLEQIVSKYSYQYEKQYLNKIAKEAFEKMCDDALAKGYYLIANSSYRSYKIQQETYDYYKRTRGSDYAKKYVAAPGFSEHQTGLAIDIGSKKISIFKNSKEYLWVKENAYKYGFILRYPEGKESITGFNPEAWHYRYVGLDAAKYIWENNITFDEYYAVFLYK